MLLKRCVKKQHKKLFQVLLKRCVKKKQKKLFQVLLKRCVKKLKSDNRVVVYSHSVIIVKV